MVISLAIADPACAVNAGRTGLAASAKLTNTTKTA